ncbi:MAG: Uncharacterised protein [SAR116 cluster bacterium]|jgi:hypothetical protein|nr:MAG: Uncharacterised protein [SAR116 cluster bacterium]
MLQFCFKFLRLVSNNKLDIWVLIPLALVCSQLKINEMKDISGTEENGKIVGRWEWKRYHDNGQLWDEGRFERAVYGAVARLRAMHYTPCWL